MRRHVFADSVKKEWTGFRLRLDALTAVVPWRQLFFAPLLVLSLGTNAQDASRKDPTVPPAVWLAAQPKTADATQQAASGETSRIQLIVAGPSRRLALIDGKVVKAGDVVNGSKVLAITPDKVIMRDAAKSLVMMPDVEKKPPALVVVRKKSVVIPADSVSPGAKGSNQ